MVDDEAFGACLDEFAVLVVFHGADFESDGGEERGEVADDLLEVAFGDEFGVFAGDEEEVAKALGVEVFGLGHDLVGGEGGAKDVGVVAGKTAVGAIIDAFVGDVEGGKEADGFAEVAASGADGLLDEGFELGVGFGCEEVFEAPEEGRAAFWQGIECLDEGHGCGFQVSGLRCW